MATVINNPTRENAGEQVGSILGIILVLFLMFMFLYYGLPFIGRATPPQVNIPDKLKINVNQP